MSRPTLRWILFGVFAVFVGFVIWIADTGRGGRFYSFIDAIPFGDKLGHFLLMGTLCFLCNVALGGRTVAGFGRPILLGSLLIALFVVAEEFSQMFIPSRTFDVGDLLADALGIGLASWLAFVLIEKRKRSNG